jgi:hypothetical protein
MEMRLPNWARAVIVVSTLMQLVFAVTLLADPTRIADTWPWPLPPLSARLLGASTLVSVPMAFLIVYVNRFAVAMIPLVMMVTYRVLQLLAGLIHIDRFSGFSLTTLNYFGGGILMMAVFGYALWAGLAGKLPKASDSAPWAAELSWSPPAWGRWILRLSAAVYVLLGLYFLFAGGSAAPMWIDANGLTPLSARLFSSPLIGLGLGLYLCSRADDWRNVAVPAIGMVTIGFAGSLSLLLDLGDLVLATPFAALVAATPLLLLLTGLGILATRPARAMGLSGAN